jgi:hypothetical protein
MQRGELRIQIFWKTLAVGNHYDHVHVGVAPGSSPSNRTSRTSRAGAETSSWSRAARPRVALFLARKSERVDAPLVGAKAVARCFVGAPDRPKTAVRGEPARVADGRGWPGRALECSMAATGSARIGQSTAAGPRPPRIPRRVDPLQTTNRN